MSVYTKRLVDFVEDNYASGNLIQIVLDFTDDVAESMLHRHWDRCITRGLLPYMMPGSTTTGWRSTRHPGLS